MKRYNWLWMIFLSAIVIPEIKSQGVSINSSNSAPDPSAILDIQSTNHGILFPRLTTVQRNTIPNPAHGLHIFNTNIGTLEYYDTIFHAWFRYCEGCGYYTDTLKASQDTLIHGYKLPQLASSYRKIILVIDSTVNLTNGYMYPNYFTPIDLSAASAGSTILIVNHGNIIGPGGSGGKGGETTEDVYCYADGAQYGSPGWDAITSKNGISLLIHNYGIIAGGGGGGGGGGAGYYASDCGGGGGGGAGYSAKGLKGIYNYLSWGNCYEDPTISLAQDGQDGTFLAGGAGGSGGQSGSPLFAGYAGGNGGGLGQPGQNGLDSYYFTGGQGGQPGKAITGNPGNNIVINYGSGAVYGSVD